ncbi:hypothetical protein D8M04_15870 [Oceanobacillus piezotolerans]|uniref:LSM domain-containing protein n=2 Tax=Oceanobacillus piezotolerans TaxID=2448030 RepID=A0A498D3L9_9BACI|nr:hypothetical protein D8M04_15870 [Oceanobacillus piezotolerans]
MAFRLRQLLDCDVKIVVDDDKKEIEGKIVFVGTDFIELLVDRDHECDHDRHRDHKKDCDCKKVFLFPFDSIKFIKKLD